MLLPQIERYELEREIGHGGMATVYRARDVRLDRWVAIKVMHPHLRGAREARARFSREARAVAKLHHPSILEIYDFSGLDSDNAYIAAELLTGPTLRAFADGRADIPAEIVACIGVELAQALAAAHAQGIIHRDVKPENVLLHEDRCVKLTDFGIAGMIDPSASAMTATGQILGSPAHMSPEQITDGSADPRSDVFALGTILYWLATGKLPFDGLNAHQVLKRVVDDEPVDPLRLRPALGKELRAVLMRCLEKRPEDRFQTAEALAVALVDWLRALGVGEPRATLAAFLADPEREAERLCQASVRALLERARARVEEGARTDAIECLDRVLSLQDGHPEALALLERLDRQARRQNQWRAAGALVGLTALATVVVVAWPAGAPEVVELPPVEPRGMLRAPSPPEAARPPVAAPSDPAEPSNAPEPARSDPDVAARSRTAGGAPAGDARAAEPSTGRTRPARPRRVIFKPYPVNVSIAVDGGPLRPLGPDFQDVELPAGSHRFRFVGGRDCCVDEVVEVDVPAGPGTTVLEPRLKFRPARLYVVSDVPANVEVGDGLVLGRTRSVISVPIERSLVELQRISVTAPGHEPYTRNVSLRAGKVKQIRVDMRPSETSP